MNQDLERLRSIKSFPSLVKYLRDDLDWPIESDDVEDLSFDYQPKELGLDPKTAVKIKEIKQLRPFVTNQPWGIFYVNFEPKRLPIVVLRRILRSLVIKKRASANKSQQRAWQQNDLLFISAYGETEEREITFAHFSEDSASGDLPTLKVLGWNTGNTILRLEDTHSTLKEKLHWPEDEDDAKEWRERWSSAFKLKYRETVRTSKDLAVKLADLASDIRIRVNEVLAVESEHGELRKLYKAFQEALIHDLTEDDFADMYAQTIAYGLLTASISRQSGGLVADNLKDMVPNTNPFLRELMQTFLTVGGRKNKIDFDELGINEVVELLRHTQMDEVLKDFGAKNPQEDPVIHFYELFLKEYDPEKRMKRGVFYTPRPVVSFIVRNVDEILRTDFGLEDGLADTTTWSEMVKRHDGWSVPDGVKGDEPFVQILDPAAGTGTFLVEVIDQIYQTLRAKWNSHGRSESEMYDLWNDYVPRHLLPRVHGFELMMAPYAIAHMKIGLKLRETHYSFLSSERARVYLTNTLDEPKEFAGYLEQMAPALAHEATAANKVKRDSSSTVILGNPPYSYASENTGEYTEKLIAEYYFLDGQPLGERNPRGLQDDFVKFIRLSQVLLDRTGVGVFGFITNNSYLDNPTYRGMRFSLVKSYSLISILDLHGNSNISRVPQAIGVDENVFEIQQGVGITLAVKLPNPSKHGAVKYVGLLGSRAKKYDSMLINFARADRRLLTVQTPHWLFVPINLDLNAEYQRFFKVTAMFPVNSVGLYTARDDFAIAFSSGQIFERLSQFVRASGEVSRNQFELGPDTTEWKVGSAQKDIRDHGLTEEKVKEISYRPFDLRFTYYSGQSRGLMCRPRLEVMQHLLEGDLSLCFVRRSREKSTSSFFCVRGIVDKGILSSADNANVAPLWCYPTEREKSLGALGRLPNLSRAFIQDFSDRLKLDFVYGSYNCADELSYYIRNPGASEGFDPFFVPLSSISKARAEHLSAGGIDANAFTTEDVFHYVYAVFHSPAYRTRYAEFLRIDFPCIPLTDDASLFRRLCALGGDLVGLHLLEDAYPAASWNISSPSGESPFSTLITRFAGKGYPEVAKGYPKYKDGSVYINTACYFEGVPEGVWNFHVGGYQVCEKWLKDRRGRTLTDQDVNHYQRIVVALNETIRLMAEIDRVIEDHGGWPLVGSSQDSGAIANSSYSTESATTKEDNANKENSLPFE